MVGRSLKVGRGGGGEGERRGREGEGEREREPVSFTKGRGYKGGSSLTHLGYVGSHSLEH